MKRPRPLGLRLRVLVHRRDRVTLVLDSELEEEVAVGDAVRVDGRGLAKDHFITLALDERVVVILVDAVHLDGTVGATSGRGTEDEAVTDRHAVAVGGEHDRAVLHLVGVGPVSGQVVASAERDDVGSGGGSGASGERSDRAVSLGGCAVRGVVDIVARQDLENGDAIAVVVGRSGVGDERDGAVWVAGPCVVFGGIHAQLVVLSELVAIAIEELSVEAGGVGGGCLEDTVASGIAVAESAGGTDDHLGLDRGADIVIPVLVRDDVLKEVLTLPLDETSSEESVSFPAVISGLDSILISAVVADGQERIFRGEHEESVDDVSVSSHFLGDWLRAHRIKAGLGRHAQFHRQGVGRAESVAGSATVWTVGIAGATVDETDHHVVLFPESHLELEELSGGFL